MQARMTNMKSQLFSRLSFFCFVINLELINKSISNLSMKFMIFVNLQMQPNSTIF